MSFGRTLYLTVILAFFLTSSVFAKPFEGKTEGVGIFVGEVACYGEHEIKPEFLDTFKDQLWQSLKELENKGKLHTVGDDRWLTGGSSSSFAGIIQVDSVLQDIHMDAIAYGPSFQKEDANVKMIYYAEKALGEDFFWNDEKLAKRKQMIGKPYHISPKLTNAVKTFGNEYKADYLLFCNLVDADIRLKNSVFNASTTELSERPKQIKVVSFFYLIDTKTGLVYEGYNLSDKTGQILNLLGQYGKAMTATNLLQCMFEVQAKRIMEDVCNEGQKVLAKGI